MSCQNLTPNIASLGGLLDLPHQCKAGDVDIVATEALMKAYTVKDFKLSDIATIVIDYFRMVWVSVRGSQEAI
jgi:hypothetical protein